MRHSQVICPKCFEQQTAIRRTINTTIRCQKCLGDVTVLAQDKCVECGGKVLPGQDVCSPCDRTAKKLANEMKSMGSRIKTVVFGIGLGALGLYMGHVGTWEALHTDIQRFNVFGDSNASGITTNELITRAHDPFWFWLAVVISSLMCVFLTLLAILIVVSGMTGTGGVGLSGDRPSIRANGRKRRRKQRETA